MNQTAYMGPIEAKQYNAARERKARLYSVKVAPKPPAPKAMIAPVVTVIRFASPPTWRRESTYFNEHVIAWKMCIVNREASPVLAYLWDRCREIGVDWLDIKSRSRAHRLIGPRHLLIWETKTNYPELSFPQIGRFFDLDHSTCIYAFRKIEGQRIRTGEKQCG